MSRIPFAALHRVHGCLDVVVVAIDLLLKVLLPFRQVIDGAIHAFHFLLTL
jgi:hypothetical protein